MTYQLQALCSSENYLGSESLSSYSSSYTAEFNSESGKVKLCSADPGSWALLQATAVFHDLQINSWFAWGYCRLHWCVALLCVQGLVFLLASAVFSKRSPDFPFKRLRQGCVGTVPPAQICFHRPRITWRWSLISLEWLKEDSLTKSIHLFRMFETMSKKKEKKKRRRRRRILLLSFWCSLGHKDVRVWQCTKRAWGMKGPTDVLRYLWNTHLCISRGGLGYSYDIPFVLCF